MYKTALVCFLLIGSALLTSACSNRQMYESILANHRLSCQKLSGIEYDECMEKANMTYDEYQRKRKELEK